MPAGIDFLFASCDVSPALLLTKLGMLMVGRALGDFARKCLAQGQVANWGLGLA